MSKRPTPAAPKPAPAPPPAPAIVPEDDDVEIVARPSRSGGGGINALRKLIVNNPDASIDDLIAMLATAGHFLAPGTIRTTRTSTLAILKLIKANQTGQPITRLEGAPEATRYYTIKHPTASVQQISTWLASKGCQATPAAVRSARSTTLAVLQVAA